MQRRKWGGIWSLFLMVLCVSGVTGCGGGGGGGSTSAIIAPVSGGSEGETRTFTLNGTVSGTLIVAINQSSGVAYSVSANNDGTFSLAVPAPAAYRFYLVENGQVASLYSGSTNVFTVSPGAFNAGGLHIADGRVVASIPPLNSPLMGGAGTDVTLPQFFTNPPTTGMTVAQVLDNGLTALKNGGWILARGYFSAASSDGRCTVAERDTALFFLALTRVAAVAASTQPTGRTSGYQQLSDLLDAAGFDRSARSSVSHLVRPARFPNTMPAGDDVRSFLRGPVVGEVTAALGNLAAVSQNFSVVWITPGPHHRTVRSDYGDVLFFQSAFLAMRGQIYVLSSYNLGDDLTTPFNQVGGGTIQGALAVNASAFTVKDPSDLVSARQDFSSSIDYAVSAINEMRSETHAQQNDFITLARCRSQDVDKWITNAPTYKSALSQQVTIGPSGNQGDLNLGNFFTAGGFALRPYIPAFARNRITARVQAPLGNVLTGTMMLGSKVAWNRSQIDISK